MKKQIATLALTAALALTVSACGSEPADTTGESTPPAETAVVQETQPVETEAAAVADMFEAFPAALDDAGYTYEVTTMGAELIGAERGEKYTFEFGSVELYRFPEGAEALTTGEVTLEGFGAFPIEVSGNYGLIVSLDENADAIVEIFKAL